MARLFLAPTANYIETTLNGAITDSATTITLSSTTNLQAPGYVVIDRTDANGTATPNSREVIFYTGVSGTDLTGCSRGADNSTARSHSSGAKVETMPTVGMWNSLATIVDTAIDNNGLLRSLTSPVTISVLRLIRTDISSVASIAEIRATRTMTSTLTVTTNINTSGASVVGLGLVPVWNLKGNFSGPTTIVAIPLPMPRVGTWDYFNVITRTVASGASAIVDINKNGTSIFDAGTRPSIAGGGTFVSTASIATKNFSAGDRFTIDYDTTGGHITDILIMGKAV